jgi:hypothetical protein
LLLVALVPIERFAVVPVLTKLPGNANISFSYEGTGTLLNAKALDSGDAANVLLKNVPLTMERQVRVVRSSGDVAVVRDDSTLHAGPTVLPSSHVYAVDRSTREPAPPPAGATVEPASGLTVGFPLHPKADSSYRYFDAATGQTVPVTYQGKLDKYFGRTVGVYHVVSTGPVKDANLSRALPASLPKKKLALMAPLLPVDLRMKMISAAATLPDPVPMHYTVTRDLRVWIDTVTGLVVNETVHQKIVAGVSVKGELVNLLRVLVVDLTVTPHSRQELARKSADTARSLTMVEVVAPIVLGVSGLILLTVAFIRRRRPSHHGSTPQGGAGRRAAQTRSPSEQIS